MSLRRYPNSGGHFLTGPIRVCGAEEGDVLKVTRLTLCSFLVNLLIRKIFESPCS